MPASLALLASPLQHKQYSVKMDDNTDDRECIGLPVIYGQTLITHSLSNIVIISVVLGVSSTQKFRNIVEY
jgi:hypothetical protein